MDFNLTRAAPTITGPTLARATTATIRMLINAPVGIASSARRLTLYLPSAWPWEIAWAELFTRICRRPRREGDDHAEPKNDPAECGGLGSFAVGLILRLPPMGVRNVDLWQVHAVCHGHGHDAPSLSCEVASTTCDSSARLQFQDGNSSSPAPRGRRRQATGPSTTR